MSTEPALKKDTLLLEHSINESANTSHDVDYNRFIGKNLIPLEKFMYGLKSADARRQYPKLLLKFLDFLSFRGTLEQKAAQLCEMANKNPDIIENQLTRFVIEQKNRVVLKQIAAGTEKLC